ncbi:MAG: flagellar type III secretion system pore protein FliP [Planctomycetota bacterium]|nr:flagellar type III secretion system pore protein FliP [Planctomycetota bacterium]
MINFRRPLLLGVLGAFVILLVAAPQAMATGDIASETGIVEKILSGSPENVGISLRLILIMTVLSIAPALLLLTTCFTRIIVVLGFVRRAIGTQESPPNQVLIGLSLMLTIAVMGPIWGDIYSNAIRPYADQVPMASIGRVPTGEEAFQYAENKVREFMYRFIDESDLLLMARVGAPAVVENQYTDDGFITSEFLNSLPTTVIMPAFVLSELRRAFEMGFMIYLPFVVIDLVVSAILVSMGMLMLPPVIVSLPFKVLVFVLVDGWGLVVEQLMVSTMVTAAG